LRRSATNGVNAITSLHADQDKSDPDTRFGARLNRWLDGGECCTPRGDLRQLPQWVDVTQRPSPRRRDPHGLGKFSARRNPFGGVRMRRSATNGGIVSLACRPIKGNRTRDQVRWVLNVTICSNPGGVVKLPGVVANRSEDFGFIAKIRSSRRRGDRGC
jgi:hypothetical protein